MSEATRKLSATHKMADPETLDLSTIKNRRFLRRTMRVVTSGTPVAYRVKKQSNSVVELPEGVPISVLKGSLRKEAIRSSKYEN